MRGFYTDRFVLPLPAGHRFPMSKYSRLRERCLAEGVLDSEHLAEPAAASWAELSLVHDPAYLARVRAGELSAREQRRIGFPWSPQMVERSRRSVGGTIAASNAALQDFYTTGWGVAANLAGGTHHAFPAHGEGFCVFNDAAVAIRVLQREGRIGRAAILDLDVHQGNGTAAIFAADPSVFTLSFHGARNYPFRRERSTLDLDLPDGTGDDAFLSAIELHVPHVLETFRPELAIYLAGADPFVDDSFGRLAVSKDGLAQRDQAVLNLCRSAGVPVAIVMAGGYARDTKDTVDIHVRTLQIAALLSSSVVPATGPKLSRAHGSAAGASSV